LFNKAITAGTWVGVVAAAPSASSAMMSSEGTLKLTWRTEALVEAMRACATPMSGICDTSNETWEMSMELSSSITSSQSSSSGSLLADRLSDRSSCRRSRLPRVLAGFLLMMAGLVVRGLATADVLTARREVLAPLRELFMPPKATREALSIDSSAFSWNLRTFSTKEISGSFRRLLGLTSFRSLRSCICFMVRGECCPVQATLADCSTWRALSVVTQVSLRAAAGAALMVVVVLSGADGAADMPGAAASVAAGLLLASANMPDLEANLMATGGGGGGAMTTAFSRFPSGDGRAVDEAAAVLLNRAVLGAVALLDMAVPAATGVPEVVVVLVLVVVVVVVVLVGNMGGGRWTTGCCACVVCARCSVTVSMGFSSSALATRARAGVSSSCARDIQDWDGLPGGVMAVNEDDSLPETEAGASGCEAVGAAGLSKRTDLLPTPEAAVVVVVVVAMVAAADLAAAAGTGAMLLRVSCNGVRATDAGVLAQLEGHAEAFMAAFSSLVSDGFRTL
jgi:hypothetical protein